MADVNQVRVEISGRVLIIGEDVISLDNVSSISTSVPKKPIKPWAVAVAFLGILLIMLGMAGPFGILFLLAGGASVALTLYENTNPPKGVSLTLNSGRTCGLIFDDHDQASQLNDTITKALNNQNINQTIYINGSVVGSSVGIFK